jgi:hypothetical protein
MEPSERIPWKAHLSRFLITHIALAAVAVAIWRTGSLSALPAFTTLEMWLVGGLLAYSLRAFWAVLRQEYERATHISNALPMWGLCFTTLGAIVAIAGLDTPTPEAVALVVRNVGLALYPNLTAVLLMTWVRELTWWYSRGEV